jgi:hypothetical protein
VDAGGGTTVVNSGIIATSANNSIGVRIAGGVLTNSGAVRSLLAGPAFAPTPTIAVAIDGDAASFSNTATGSVAATHIGVRLSGSHGIGLDNAGRIEARPAIRFDGTAAPGGAAVLIAAGSGADISNTGTIAAAGGLPALVSLGPRVSLRNSGTIVGDILLSGGDDIIVVGESAVMSGAIDFGAGQDALFIRGGGILDRPIANLERLTKSGPSALIFVRDITVSAQINVLGGDGIVIARGTRLSAAVTDNLGMIRGGGILAGALDNAGTVAPGTAAEPGTLTVTGAFRQFAGGTLAVRLFADGNADRLAVGGPATLAGTLALSYDLAAGAAFRDGQRFEVVVPAGHR